MVVPSPQGGGYAAFFPGFPLGGIHSQTFDRLSLWKFNEKASAIFYDTALSRVVNQI